MKFMISIKLKIVLVLDECDELHLFREIHEFPHFHSPLKPNRRAHPSASHHNGTQGMLLVASESLHVRRTLRMRGRRCRWGRVAPSCVAGGGGAVSGGRRQRWTCEDPIRQLVPEGARFTLIGVVPVHKSGQGRVAATVPHKVRNCQGLAPNDRKEGTERSKLANNAHESFPSVSAVGSRNSSGTEGMPWAMRPIRETQHTSCPGEPVGRNEAFSPPRHEDRHRCTTG